jgi:hypothetical protein
MARQKEKVDETGKRRRWGCIAVICGVVALVVIVIMVVTYIVLHQIPETPKEAFFNDTLDGFVEIELSRQDFGLQSALHRIVSTFNQRHPQENPTSVDQVFNFIDFLLYPRIYLFIDNDAKAQTREVLIVLNFKRLGAVIHMLTKKMFKQAGHRTGTGEMFLKYPIFEEPRGTSFYSFTKSSLLMSNSMEMLKQGILQQERFREQKWHASTSFQQFLANTPQRGIAHGFLINSDNWFRQALDDLIAKTERPEHLAALHAQLQQADILTDQINGLRLVVELLSFEALKATVYFDCADDGTAGRLASLLRTSILPSIGDLVQNDIRLKADVEQRDSAVEVILDIRGIEKFLDQLAGQIETQEGSAQK